MQDWSFENIDEEDLGDIILKVETAFNIQFLENEPIQIYNLLVINYLHKSFKN